MYREPFGADRWLSDPILAVRREGDRLDEVGVVLLKLIYSDKHLRRPISLDICCGPRRLQQDLHAPVFTLECIMAERR